ncbi:diacylglycerol O-acyltransferase 1-like isoform X1 [Photinus pyralis]|uniref:diacylglycerol O-acyltransferase 1-like isoform X1 n=1 Tax=Photinus pyralis TaxID=7054 RepID=UPI0012677747|nr:diacylglycerol O-acyltransferase 1-like isoform X1 [Photinus pyralis]
MNESRSIQKKQRSANGLSNWFRLMLAITLAILALDNYRRFGIIMNPFEIVKLVTVTIFNHSWLYGIIFLCILQQMAQTFFIEKLLSWNRLSERQGMTLHAINAFFVAVTFVVTVRFNQASFGVIRTVSSTLVQCSIIKTWSYAYVNKELRKQSIKRDDKGTSQYPRNVTLKNLCEYMLCTPHVQYKLSYPDRQYPTFRECMRQLFLAFSVICGMTFLAKQFIFPELKLLKHNHFNGTEKVQRFFTVMVFLHLFWILGYFLFYRIIHPTYAILTGMPHVVFEEDWWNSPNMDEFWRLWNRLIYDALKLTVMIPLLRKGFGKRTAKTISFLIAGLLHEIVNTLPLGIYSGAGILVTLFEIPVGYVSTYVTRRFGDEVGNTLIWVYFNINHTVSFVFAYITYDLFEA